MRKLEIWIGLQEAEEGRQIPKRHPCEGLVKNSTIAPEIIQLAGWPPDTDFAIEISRTDDTFLDVSFEEDRANAELIGNMEYGFMDADSESRGWEELNPNKGESWAYVINQRVYFN